jgi:hypothetical protein
LKRLAMREDVRRSFPIRDRYTVSGLVVGDVCFECRCRVLELAGEDDMILAWCECEFPQDAAEMEVF